MRWPTLAFLLVVLLASTAHASEPLAFNLHMSDCENRWVVLRKDSGETTYRYGFVYIDPDAGFTLHIGGRFTIDDEGKFQKAADPLDSEKFNVKIRLDGNGVAALLPREAISQLGLADPPEWMKYYADNSDPITHKIRWGTQYNQIGDSAKAVTYLEPVYREKPDADRVEFELAYAYNALGRSEEAIAVLKTATARKPKEMFLCKELAFAELATNRTQASIDRHLTCISLCSKDQDAEKSEMAMNIAHAYKTLGDNENSQKWLSNAKLWAPQDSPVYNFFHPSDNK